SHLFHRGRCPPGRCVSSQDSLASAGRICPLRGRVVLPRSVFLVLMLGLLALIGSAPAGSGTLIARGLQQGTPAAEEGDASPISLDQIAPYPDGITLTALALVALDQVPANPASIRLERYTLAGTEALSGASPGPRLVVVESGELLLDGED